jgi:hypothetical protein
MVSALTTSIMIDSKLISFSLLHALTEMHVRDRYRKERDGNGYPKDVFHNHLSELELHQNCHRGSIFRVAKVGIPRVGG